MGAEDGRGSQPLRSSPPGLHTLLSPPTPSGVDCVTDRTFWSDSVSVQRLVQKDLGFLDCLFWREAVAMSGGHSSSPTERPTWEDRVASHVSEPGWDWILRLSQALRLMQPSWRLAITWWETLNQSRPATPLQNSWPPETGGLMNDYCCFKPLSLGVTCYTTMDN